MATKYYIDGLEVSKSDCEAEREMGGNCVVKNIAQSTPKPVKQKSFYYKDEANNLVPEEDYIAAKELSGEGFTKWDSDGNLVEETTDYTIPLLDGQSLDALFEEEVTNEVNADIASRKPSIAGSVTPYGRRGSSIQDAIDDADRRMEFIRNLPSRYRGVSQEDMDKFLESDIDIDGTALGNLLLDAGSLPGRLVSAAADKLGRPNEDVSFLRSLAATDGSDPVLLDSYDDALDNKDDLVNSIESYQSEISDLDKAIENSQDPRDINSMEAKRDKLSAEVDTLTERLNISNENLKDTESFTMDRGEGLGPLSQDIGRDPFLLASFINPSNLVSGASKLGTGANFLSKANKVGQISKSGLPGVMRGAAAKKKGLDFLSRIGTGAADNAISETGIQLLGEATNSRDGSLSDIGAAAVLGGGLSGIAAVPSAIAKGKFEDLVSRAGRNRINPANMEDALSGAYNNARSGILDYNLPKDISRQKSKINKLGKGKGEALEGITKSIQKADNSATPGRGIYEPAREGMIKGIDDAKQNAYEQLVNGRIGKEYYNEFTKQLDEIASDYLVQETKHVDNKFRRARAADVSKIKNKEDLDAYVVNTLNKDPAYDLENLKDNSFLSRVSPDDLKAENLVYRADRLNPIKTAIDNDYSKAYTNSPKSKMDNAKYDAAKTVRRIVNNAVEDIGTKVDEFYGPTGINVDADVTAELSKAKKALDAAKELPQLNSEVDVLEAIGGGNTNRSFLANARGGGIIDDLISDPTGRKSRFLGNRLAGTAPKVGRTINDYEESELSPEDKWLLEQGWNETMTGANKNNKK